MSDTQIVSIKPYDTYYGSATFVMVPADAYDRLVNEVEDIARKRLTPPYSDDFKDSAFELNRFLIGHGVENEFLEIFKRYGINTKFITFVKAMKGG